MLTVVAATGAHSSVCAGEGAGAVHLAGDLLGADEPYRAHLLLGRSHREGHQLLQALHPLDQRKDQGTPATTAFPAHAPPHTHTFRNVALTVLLAQRTFVHRNMFDFKHISTFERGLADQPGPMVLFATPGMLHAGTSLEVFKKWAPNEKNLVIIPGYCVVGTVGNKLAAGRKVRTALLSVCCCLWYQLRAVSCDRVRSKWIWIRARRSRFAAR